MSRPALVLIGLLLTSPFGCGSDRDVGDAPERRVIDLTAGTYRGVGIGDTRGGVEGVLGPATHAGQGAYIAPLAIDIGDSKSSPSGECEVSRPLKGPFGTLRYEEQIFLFDDERSCGWTTVKDGDATQEGVAVGDTLEDARNAYPALRCGEAELGEDGLFGPTGFRFCKGRVAPRRYVWFGEDPIQAIEVNNKPLGS